MLITLWSTERGTGLPLRQRTARESPQFATNMYSFVKIDTKAVDPIKDNCGLHLHILEPLPSPPHRHNLNAISSILWKLRLIAVLQCSPLPFESSPTTFIRINSSSMITCMFSLHSPDTCSYNLISTTNLNYYQLTYLLDYVRDCFIKLLF